MIDISAKQLHAFDLLPHPVWVFAQDSLKVVAANAAACDWLGYPRDGLVGIAITEIRPPGERDALRARIAAFLADDQAEVAAYPDAWQIRARSGAMHHASVHWRKVMHDGRPAVLATFTDLTDEHRVQQRLQTREAELAQQPGRAPLSDSAFTRLIDAAPGKMLVLCPETHQILAGTAAFARATGKRPSQLRGRGFFDAFPPASHEEGARDAERLRHSFRRVERSKSADVLPVIRYAITGPDGVLRERSWSIVNTPVLDDRGALEFIIVRVLDVTELSTHAQGSDASQGDATALSGLLHDLILRADETEARLVRLASLEALFQRANVLENISEAVFTLDEDWRFTYVNAEAERLLHRRRDELLDRVIWDEFPAAIGSAFQTTCERVRADGRSRRFTEYFAPLETWFEVNANAVPDGLAVYFRDVTQDRRRNEKLRLLGLAVENLNDMVLVTDADLDAPDGPRITFLNPAFSRFMGYAEEDVLGRTPRMFQGPETDRAERSRIRAALEQGQPVRGELINYRHDGQPYWLELVVNPVHDEAGAVVSFVAIQRDISERKQAEQDNRINEERFRLVASMASDAIWDLDLQTGNLWWSRGLTEIFGHASDPDQWTTTTWREHVHPDDLERILQLEDDAMDSGARRFTQEYRFRMGDGSWALVSDSRIIFRDDGGKPVRMLGSLSNISEKRAADERRQQAQRLEAIGQLTGGVAHDFNNILTVILGNAEMLLDHLGDDAQAHAMADVTIRAAERGAELTDRLLAFARRKPLEPKVLDLNKRLPAAEHLIRRTLPESIDIEIDRAPGLWATEVDPGQLEVALLNLAVNARDAMPDGGRLTIETHNTWLDEGYAASHSEVSAGEYVLLSVSDTGHGMDQDTLQRAFEPFYTTKEVGRGSGLGLSMVFGFVKQSGGHLKIYSEIGEGSTIKMYFPRVHLEPTQVDAAAERRRLPRGNEQILVVEDDAPVRENLCNQLLSLGYQVSSAANADAAMKIVLERDDIDLLLTDVIMPGSMHGGELAQAATAVRPELRVLFTSGYTENAIVHNGRLDPGVAFLGKPYRLRELAQKVRVALDSEQSSERQR